MLYHQPERPEPSWLCCCSQLAWVVHCLWHLAQSEIGYGSKLGGPKDRWSYRRLIHVKPHIPVLRLPWLLNFDPGTHVSWSLLNPWRRCVQCILHPKSEHFFFILTPRICCFEAMKMMFNLWVKWGFTLKLEGDWHAFGSQAAAGIWEL